MPSSQHPGTDEVLIYCRKFPNPLHIPIDQVQRSPFRHVFARQCASGRSDQTLDLADDDLDTVCHLLSYGRQQRSYTELVAVHLAIAEAVDVARDYLLAAKYNAEDMKNDIIRSLDELKISPECSLKSWLEFLTMVYGGLTKPDPLLQTYFEDTFQAFVKARSTFTQHDSKGFKALISMGGSLADDVFIVYHTGSNEEQQHIRTWPMAEENSEVEQRRWELHPSVPNEGANTATEDTSSTPA
ncbi:MAG: hypothetical protein Q9226_006896 [Calogaya cf. arnoldii]